MEKGQFEKGHLLYGYITTLLKLIIIRNELVFY